MIMKWLKRSVIVVAGVSIVGGMLFGKDVVSYVRSSAKSVQTVVKDSVPIEFELRRARDLLEEIIPEMHANIRLIAEDEVEVAVADHIARQSPAYVIADIDAKCTMLDHLRFGDDGRAVELLKLFAARYREHSDWQPAWLHS